MIGGNPFRQWKTVIAVSLLAFSSGVVVGVAGTMHYVSNNLPRIVVEPDRMPERIVRQLRRDLDLTEDQSRQVLEIFEHGHEQLRSIRLEAEPRIDVILQDTFDEVFRVLKPEQQEAWRDWFDTMKRKFTPPEKQKETAVRPGSKEGV